MIAGLLSFGLGRLVVSATLAGLAWLVCRSGARPTLQHTCWLLVLGAMFVPPVAWVGLPLGPDARTAEAEPRATPTGAAGPAHTRPGEPVGRDTGSTLADLADGPTLLVLLWAAGSAGVLVLAGLRLRRFHALLVASSSPTPGHVERLVRELAERLGLAAPPSVVITSASVAPMVWAPGRRTAIVLPAGFVDAVDGETLRWTVAHELAHVARGDHRVRAFVQLSCALFWWNPITWLAQRRLHEQEELCCDELVLTGLAVEPAAYAHALFGAIEFLATPAHRPPAVACSLHDGGPLHRRFEMILSSPATRHLPRGAQVAAILLAVGLAPWGFAPTRGDAAPTGPAAVQELHERVDQGDLSVEEARALFDALRPDPWATEQHAPFRAGMDAAVRAGVTTRAAAEAKRAELAPNLHAMDFRMQVLGESPARALLAVGLEQGRLSREELAEEVRQLRERLAQAERTATR